MSADGPAGAEVERKLDGVGPLNRSGATGTPGRPIAGWGAQAFDLPDTLLGLQATSGNRAVTDLIHDGRQRIQRAPAKPSGTHPAKGAPSDKSSAVFDSYAATFYAWEQFAKSVIDRQGAGLGAVELGSKMTGPQKKLLEDMRQVLFDLRSSSDATRKHAMPRWAPLARKLESAVEEAVRAGMSRQSGSRIVDEIDLVTREFVQTKKTREEITADTEGDLSDAMTAMAQLLYVSSRWGEGSHSIQREEVQGRQDAEVSDSMRQLNAKQRGDIKGLTFGKRLTGRHAKVLEALRTALLLARSEAPDSAQKAFALYQAIQPDLMQIWEMGSALGQEVFESDPVQITKKMTAPEIKQLLTTTRDTLGEHVSAVHSKKVEVVLSKQRPKGQLKQMQKVAQAAGGEKLVAAMAESAGIDDFRNAMDVIQNHLVKTPERPGIWTIQNGPTTMLISEAEALGLHANSKSALKQYMQSLVSALAYARNDYDSIKLGNSRTKLRILGALGGADDPGSFDKELAALIELRNSTVYPMVDGGNYVGAFELFVREKPEVERRVKAEADYDADLDKGYSRLATTMAVVQVALMALVPIAGEAALATAPAWAVGLTAVGAGTGGAFVGEGTRQLATGDHDLGKLGSRTWQGTMVGVSAIAPAATRGVGGALESAGFGTAGGEFMASTLVSGTQSKMSGGSFLEGSAAGGLGWGAGKLTAPLGTGIPGKVAQTVTGAGVSSVTGGDAITGAAGSFVGSFAKAPPTGSDKSAAPPPTDAPAAPIIGADTVAGTGIAPKPPAPPAPPAPPTPPVAGAETIPGTGITPKTPAPPTPPVAGAETIPGTGITPKSPAPSSGTPKARAGGTQPADPMANTQPAGGADIGSAPTQAGGNTVGTQAPKGSGSAAPAPASATPWKPSNVRRVVTDPVEIKQIFHEQSRSADPKVQPRILNGRDRDFINDAWQHGYQQTGDAPIAWIDSDGRLVVDISKVEIPLRASEVPQGPTPAPAGGTQPADPMANTQPAGGADIGSAPTQAGGNTVGTQAPKGSGSAAPAPASATPWKPSNVRRVVTDPVEIKQIFHEQSRSADPKVQPRILNGRDRDFINDAWQHGYQQTGDAPIAWIDSDGRLVVDISKVEIPLRASEVPQGPTPAPAGGTQPAVTIPGTGIQPRVPAGQSGSGSGGGTGTGGGGGGGGAGANETIPGTGIQPRPPAGSSAGGGGGQVDPHATTEGASSVPVDVHAATGAVPNLPAGQQQPAGASSVPVDSIGPAGAQAGSALVDPVQSTAARPVGSGAGTARVAPGQAPVIPPGASDAPKGRALLSESTLPAQLPEAANKVYDIDELNANRHHLGHDEKLDMPAGKPAPSSAPSAKYPAEEKNRYVDTGEKPVAGISATESSIVVDTHDNKKYLFKPTTAEKAVDRAEERGIRASEQAPREVAAPMVAEAVGVDAAKTRLATIDGKEGVLIEWKEKNTIRDLAIADYPAFKRLVASEQFRDAMTTMDAFDYLINNLDRGTNFGNYLYEFLPNGQLKLTAIDHGLTFTSTTERADIYGYTRQLPEKYPPELVKNLERLEQGREAFKAKLEPFVGHAAVEAFDARLTIMISDMRAKQITRMAGQ